MTGLDEVSATRASAATASWKNIPDISYWIGVVVLAMCVWLPRLNGPIDLRYDGGVYYLLGSSLAHGNGYRIESEPGSPQAIQYPPLLPFWVVLHQRMLGTTDPRIIAPWLRISYFITFVLYAAVTALLARRYLPLGFAFAATAFTLLHFETIFLSDLLFAELPLALITVLFILSVSTRTSLPGFVLKFLPFLLAVAAFLLKTAGIVLLAAFVFDAFVKRRWSLALIRSLLAILPVIGWQAYVAHIRQSQDYKQPAYSYQRAAYQYYNVSYAENISLVDPFQPELGRLTLPALAKRMWSDFPKLLAVPGESMIARQDFWAQLWRKWQYVLLGRGVLPRWLYFIAIYGLSSLIFAGLAILTLDGGWSIAFVTVGSIGLAWLTPWPGQYHRYLVPVGALICIAGVKSLHSVYQWLVHDRFPAIARAVMMAGVFVPLFGVEVYASGKLYRSRAKTDARASPQLWTGERYFAHDQTWQGWEEAAAWLRANAPPDSITATSAPHFFYLRTGLRAILPPMEPRIPEARELLSAVPVSYVIVDQLQFVDISRRYARPAVEGTSQWKRVYDIHGTTIYQRTRE